MFAMRDQHKLRMNLSTNFPTQTAKQFMLKARTCVSVLGKFINNTRTQWHVILLYASGGSL